jgi:hypothetical protein
MAKTITKPVSKLIDQVKIKSGRLIRVWNTEKPKFSNANSWYTSVWVEDANGKNERCLLFTAKEIERAEHRAKKNKEDLTKKTFFTDLLD